MLTLVIAASAVSLAACGSSGSDSADVERETVGQPPGVAAQAIVRDITVLGRAQRAATTEPVLVSLFSLVNTARSLPNDREGWKGLSLVRRRMPQILRQFFAAYPRTRDELAHLDMRTASGVALRSWLLDTYESQRRQLSRLDSEVRSGGYAWAAVLRWSEENATARARSEKRLNSIVQALPASQRVIVDRAITNNLG
jgi:hypothetical protein